MQPHTPEFTIPSDELLSVFKIEDLPVDTPPTPVTTDLLEQRVAIATVYEHGDEVLPYGTVHVGRVALINEQTGVVHLAHRETSNTAGATLIMPEAFHAPVIRDPQTPNFTTTLPIRALFYLLPQQRPQNI